MLAGVLQEFVHLARLAFAAAKSEIDKTRVVRDRLAAVAVEARGVLPWVKKHVRPATPPGDEPPGN